MTETVERPRNPRGQGEQLRDELITAADRLLAEAGDPDKLSIRGIAAAAGVTPASLYRHFPDKATLVHAVIEARYADVEASLGAAIDAATTPRRRLRAGLLAWIGYGLENPGHYEALFGAHYRDRPHPGSRSFVRLGELIDAARADGATADGIAFQLWIHVHGQVELRNRTHVDFPPVETLLDDLLERYDLAG